MINILHFGSIRVLKTAWDELYGVAGNDNPFLSWDWMYRWGTSAEPNSQTYIGVYKVSGMITALICVRIRHKRLEFHCDPNFADYTGALCRPGHQGDLVAILHELSKRFSPLFQVFRPVRSVDAVSHVLDKYFSAGDAPWRRARFAVNPIVRIVGSFDQYFKSRDKRLRQEIRITENRLKTLGGWDFVIGKTFADREEMYLSLVEFHLRRQVGKVGTSIFGDQRDQEFFRALLHRDDMSFSAQMSVIRIGTRIVSAAYSLRCANTLYYWIPSFDSTIRSVSLGKLHIKCLIEYCYRNGILCFDFMGGDEPYKFQWSNDTYEIYDYRAFRNLLLANVFDMIIRSRVRLKALSAQYGGIGDLWHRVSKLFR